MKQAIRMIVSIALLMHQLAIIGGANHHFNTPPLPHLHVDLAVGGVTEPSAPFGLSIQMSYSYLLFICLFSKLPFVCLLFSISLKKVCLYPPDKHRENSITTINL